MSFNSQGTYTSVPGAETAVPGNVVQSSVWDAIHASLRVALTQAMQSCMGSADLNNILSSNGGFEVWQRGAGASSSIGVAASTTAYTADRWYITTGANQAYTIAAVAGLQNGSNLAGAVTRNAAQTGVGAIVFGYPLDTDEVVRLRGKKVSLNFYASSGAGWSPASGTFTATLYVGTGAVAKRGAGFTNETNVLQIATNIAAGTGATNVIGISSSTVPTNVTQGELQFTWTPVGTAAAADTITFDDVQMEASSYVQNGFIPSYERLPFPMMLTECKKYYRKSFPYATAPAQSAGATGAIGAVSSAAAFVSAYWMHEPQMRITPVYTTYNPAAANANWRDITGSVDLAVGVDLNTQSQNGVLLYSAAAAAANRICALHIAADAGI